MVYMNGLALIDAMDKLGIPPHTNFFTNPINATLTSSVALSGSVQVHSHSRQDLSVRNFINHAMNSSWYYSYHITVYITTSDG